MSLLLNRFEGHGLYLLDEPEAALSPTRQMAMLSRMHQLINDNSQFIIATHSPIVLAYPDSLIYQLGKYGPEEVEYDQTDHYLISKEFLNNREKMLEELFVDDDS